MVFAHRLQCLAVEGLDTDKHLVTAGASEQRHEFRILGDLGIALAVKWKVQALVDHRLQQLADLGKLVEVVRHEHNYLDAAAFCPSQALEGAVDARTAYRPAGDLDDRTVVAPVRTTPYRIDTQHGRSVPGQIGRAGWVDQHIREILGPAPVGAVHGFQFTRQGVVEDLAPDQLRLGQGKAHSPPLQQRGIAGHRVRPTDHAVSHAVMESVGGQVEGSMELMGLDTDQCKQRDNARVMLQQAQVVDILVDVLVHRVDSDRRVTDVRRGQAGNVIEGGIGHVPFFETLHRAVRAILARLNKNHPKRLHDVPVAKRPEVRARRFPQCTAQF